MVPSAVTVRTAVEAGSLLVSVVDSVVVDSASDTDSDVDEGASEVGSGSCTNVLVS
jgi:hypothetical protein